MIPNRTVKFIRLAVFDRKIYHMLIYKLYLRTDFTYTCNSDLFTTPAPLGLDVFRSNHLGDVVIRLNIYASLINSCVSYYFV